jgi:Zn-dependent M28 family amino/carboxypeptidase
MVSLSVFVSSFIMGSSSEKAGWERINTARILENIKVLSSDEYEGRAPATKRETLTTAYIESKFKKIGLKPGNPDGTYFQNVPMVGIKVDPSAELVFTNTVNGRCERLKFADDFVSGTQRIQPTISIDADVVFVGYGIEAPEYQWDDFKGVDVKNKIIVILINDPPVPDLEDPSKLDEKTFKGKAMTRYGIWTYKVEEAKAKGALGCFIVHQEDQAGCPWEFVRTIFMGERSILKSADNGMSCCAIEGLITYEKAKTLFSLAGKDFDELAKSAVSRDFIPVDLHVKASLSLRNTFRTINSKNVVGKVVGSDPKVSDEYVIYSAHWDHLGIGTDVDGNKIYHGALDNASGVAGLLELADAFVHAPLPPKRSILFLSTTGEESGLIGSQYYSEHPLYPLTKTLADINIDVMNPFGRTKDFTVVGLGQSTLDDVLYAVAADQGRDLKSDWHPEKGFFYCSDQFSFAKQGVPSIYLYSGRDFPCKPQGWGTKMWNTYFSEDYHKPTDTIKPYWDLSGIVDDLRLLGEVGYRVANSKTFPEWVEGAEFNSKLLSNGVNVEAAT